MNIRTVIARLSDGNHELHQKAALREVELTESLLKSRLPESFRTFVMEFSNGAYLYMVQEVCCVGEGNKIQSLQEAYQFRKEKGEVVTFRDTGGELLIENLIPYSFDSNGNAWCFLSRKNTDNECEVAYLDIASRKVYGKLESFTKWLNTLAENRKEVIRTLYDENVIYNELGLG
jgi:hypothetical protein